jgi:hypothetical protein
VTELETRLIALRDELEWPATPDLAAVTATRIDAEPQQRRRRPWPSPAPWLRPAPALAAVLAVVVAAGVLLAASPGVRARVADWLGIGAVRVERVDRMPAVGPADDLGIGERTTLAAARRDAPVPTVTALGPPDGVYVGQTDFGQSVSLVYLGRAGLPPSRQGIGALLTVLPGDDGLDLVRKLVDPSVRLRPLRVNGARGLFIEGRHVLVPPRRLAGNTLVWTTSGMTYRLETELGYDAALRLARSVR